MSGSPIIPIKFLADVVEVTEETVTLKPVGDKDATNYFKLAPRFIVDATPLSHDGDGHNQHSGDAPDEGHKP